jgi:hypothetical protein
MRITFTARSRVARTALIVLVAAGLVGGLSSCRPDVSAPAAAVVTTSAAEVPAAEVPAAGVSAAGTAAPPSATGTGSVTVAISAPVSVTGTVAAPVSCAIGRTYRATVSSAVVQGNQVTFGVSIAAYRGAGSYPAIVSVTLHQSSGAVTTLAAVSQVPAVITATGGSFTVTATGTEGRTFSGSLAWACGS